MAVGLMLGGGGSPCVGLGSVGGCSSDVRHQRAAPARVRRGWEMRGSQLRCRRGSHAQGDAGLRAGGHGHNTRNRRDGEGMRKDGGNVCWWGGEGATM